ncbi:C4-dicarboxylate transport system (Permease small protein) [uncultured delta proteobacterium]|uniref:C4-dicarboxylate transport system (Permease small protein) n=1 Tax=uncultured delta proteobacterium TaxID=34034 RepID=A0A212KBB1_9DELT|nr:C4-dicarboxylate transport system (Permease small protein) [uncultured delta proteobacterium]
MKILRWFDEHFEETIMMALLSLMVVIMGAQVFMRYVVGKSLGWPEELSRYLFVWISFLGMSYAIKTDTGLKIDIVYTFIPRLKLPLTIIGDAIYLVFCLFLIGPGFSAIKRLAVSGQLSSAMQIPMWLVYMSLMLGLVLSILRLVQKYVLMGMNARKPARVEEE